MIVAYEAQIVTGGAKKSEVQVDAMENLWIAKSGCSKAPLLYEVFGQIAARLPGVYICEGKWTRVA